MDKFTVSEKLSAWMIEIRRHLHRHPELSFEEHETASYLRQKLSELGIGCRTGVAGTGVVADLGPPDDNLACVALRADMDGLPLEERTGLAFSSQKPGVMHACGHDGHMAILLGAAALLSKRSLPGRVRLLFQPAEEKGGGAKLMVEEGVLDGVDHIFGGHIDRHFQVGEVAVQPGLICAYTDEFKVEIIGKGGHAAKPHETVDSIVVASLLVMSIQTLVSREINPAYPSVITVGKIHGGTASNVIANNAVLEGTIRTTDIEVRQNIKKGLARMVKAMEDLYNAQTRILFIEGYPPVINDEAMSLMARRAVKKVVGETGVCGLPYPSMGGEDFSFFLNRVSGCFLRFGARKEGLVDVPAHSPGFDFDEKVLAVGASVMAQVACDVLKKLKNDK